MVKSAHFLVSLLIETFYCFTFFSAIDDSSELKSFFFECFVKYKYNLINDEYICSIVSLIFFILINLFIPTYYYYYLPSKMYEPTWNFLTIFIPLMEFLSLTLSLSICLSKLSFSIHELWLNWINRKTKFLFLLKIYFPRIPQQNVTSNWERTFLSRHFVRTLKVLKLFVFKRVCTICTNFFFKIIYFPKI